MNGPEDWIPRYIRTCLYLPLTNVLHCLRNVVDGAVLEIISGGAWDNAACCFRSTNLFVTHRDSDELFRFTHRITIKR